MNFQRGLSIICVVFLFACNQSSTTSGTAPDVLASNIDSSINPGQDFFEYANGGWIKKNPIPADESGWGIGNLVQEELYDRLKKINEKAVEENAAHGSISKKISDFWQSGMDTVSLEKQGLSPLQESLAIINKIGSTEDIINTAALFHKKGIGCMFGEYIAQDDKNSEAMAYQLYQGGLGMPNRDYYFNTDSKTTNVREAY